MRDGVRATRWMALVMAVGLLAVGCARRRDPPVVKPAVVEPRGYYTAAAQRTEEVLQRLEGQFGADDPRLIGSLMTLSMIYFRQDRRADSDALLERAWRLIELNPELEIAKLHIPLRHGSLPTAVRLGDRLDVRGHLAMGSDIRQRDARGMTALHHAAVIGDAEMVALLLEQGAVATARDWEQKTARQRAEEAGQTAIAEILGRSVMAGRPAAMPTDSGDRPVPDDPFAESADMPIPLNDFYAPPSDEDDSFGF